MLCCALVLLLHTRSRRLAQFPSTVTLWRIGCDLLLCCQLMWLNGRLVVGSWSARGEREDDGVQYEDAVATCTPALAFLAQFSLFGSLGWCALC